ncbi:MAG: PTS IIA-like nitrogen regulatory protein PtsN [Gammaproteobacteria bacterium]|nr:PTS IIA-like nitrogen regulatory protein PtsN [Gammaproteobacteria bacterium]
MKIEDLLSVQRVVQGADVVSKKKVLELLSQLLADSLEGLTQGKVFDSLLSRERLGSTGLGHGVAIPHGRIAGLSQATAAFVQLRKGIDYDAVDQQPVDLLFALLVPVDATEEHLQVLATLAEKFNDIELREHLRQATSNEALQALLQKPI